MARPMNPRKRPAPGTSPPLQQSTLSQHVPVRYPTASVSMADEPYYNLGRPLYANPAAITNPVYPDPTLDADLAAYGSLDNSLLQPPTDVFGQHPQHPQPPTPQPQLLLQSPVNLSGQPGQDPANQQLVPRAPQPFPGGQHTWADYRDASQGDGQGENGYGNDEDNIDDLERRAQVAKREAQAKRKSIPPFVQKLSRCVGAAYGERQSMIANPLSVAC